MRPEGRGGRTPYGNGMQPTLTWIDLTASDRDKMRRVLDLFNEQGTLDEMGLGSLRDTVSDALFPGRRTSRRGYGTSCSSRGSTSGWRISGSVPPTWNKPPAGRKSI